MRGAARHLTQAPVTLCTFFGNSAAMCTWHERNARPAFQHKPHAPTMLRAAAAGLLLIACLTSCLAVKPPPASPAPAAPAAAPPPAATKADDSAAHAPAPVAAPPSESTASPSASTASSPPSTASPPESTESPPQKNSTAGTPTAPPRKKARPAAGTSSSPKSPGPPASGSTSSAPAPVAASAPPAPGSRSAVAASAPETPRAPTLDLDSLEQRLRDTRAIGVFTKLSLKNQVDDLLDQFRAFHSGRIKEPLAELRQRYDLLLLKVLTLLQDGDPTLASTISASREAIWGILIDPVKFSNI